MTPSTAPRTKGVARAGRRGIHRRRRVPTVVAVLAVVAGLAVTLGACSWPGGSPPSSSSSTSTTGAGEGTATEAEADGWVETFTPPAEGRDWTVLVEDPERTGRVAEDLRDAGLSLTSVNHAVGMVTLRSPADDVAATAEGVDGVLRAVTDRGVGWSPGEPAEPSAPDSGSDRATADDLLQPPTPPEGGDPFDGWLWGMTEIDAPAARAVATGDPEVRVGVIDTGVDSTHPDLAEGYDTRSRSFVTDLPDLDGTCEHQDCVDPVGTDGHGHGTHVAGTIAAAANGLGVRGVAPQVSIVDLRAGQDSGYFFLGPVVNALTQAAEDRLDVVNMSFYIDPWLYACPGGAPEDGPEQAAAQDVALELVHRALGLAHERGVTLVTAAGNSGLDLADPGVDTTSPNYGADPHERTVDPTSCEILPVDSPHVITVASVDEGGTRSSFSNWTSEPTSGVPTLAAPGGSAADGSLGILSAAPRSHLQAIGSVDDEGRVTVSGASSGVVRDCPEGIGPTAADPDARCGLYQWLRGTSMAAPHVSGVAALVLSQDPDLGPDEVAERLRESAQDTACPGPGSGGSRSGGSGSVEASPVCTGTTERNGFFGEGVLDAAAAVR